MCIYQEDGSQVIISNLANNIAFLSLKISFVLANSVETDEMPCYMAFHQCRHCLPKYSIRGYNFFFNFAF